MKINQNPDWLNWLKDASIDKNLPFIAQKIFEDTYLHPCSEHVQNYPNFKSTNLKDGVVKRHIHGAMHASRVAIFALIFFNLYLKYKYPDAMKLTQAEVNALIIGAVEHDSARRNEGQDLDEEVSANNAVKLLSSQGVPKFIIDAVYKALVDKDIPHDLKNILEKAMHDGDCLEITRTHPKFIVEYLDFFKDMKDNKAAIAELNKVVTEAFQMIAAQGDLCWDSTIALPSIVDGNKGEVISSKATLNFETKAIYEHAPNAFEAIAKDIASYPTLAQHFHTFKIEVVKKEIQPKVELVTANSLDYQLLGAVFQGKLNEVKIHISNGGNVNAVELSRNCNSLQLAIVANKKEIATEIIKSSGNSIHFSSRTIDNKTTVQLALENWMDDLALEISKIKINHDFLSAAANGDLTAMKKSLADGADVNSIESSARCNALQLAVLYNRPEVVSALIEAGINLQYKAPKTVAALQLACDYKRDSITQELLQYEEYSEALLKQEECSKLLNKGVSVLKLK